MQIKTVKDLIDFKNMGRTERPGGEYYEKIYYYEYTLEQLDPLFNFVEKILGEGYYRDKPKKGTEK